MTRERSEKHLPPMSGPGPEEGPGWSGAVPQVEGYGITGPLGRGGMGVVWSAVQLSTHRQVALKLLGRGDFGSEKACARFEREVELTARLQHPNIARIYDSGLHQDVYYYAMELIDGVPLDKYVTDRGLTQCQALELIRTVCEAVQHAHQRGVIHRDLKPSNILVTPDAQPHLLDFGLAKGFLEGDSRVFLSTDGEAAGTPAYMSPEQAAGHIEQIDTRTDVYSLGVILFRLLTGESPHDLSGTPYEVMRRIAGEDVRRPREITKDVDRELEALLLKALAHDPKDRYPSAGALAEDINNYLAGEPLSARPPTTAYFLRKRIRKYRVRFAIGSAVLAALVGMAVFAYVRIADERAKALASQREESKQRQKAQEALRKAGQENYYNVVALADARIADSLLDQAEALLWNMPKEPRGWEWGRLMRLCRAELLTVIRPTDPWWPGTGRGLIWAADFSSDGRRVAAGTPDGVVKIWDAYTGGEVLSLGSQDSRYEPLSVAFSPDGKRLLVGLGTILTGSTRVKVWDTEAGNEISTIEGDRVTLSPDGRRALTVTKDRTAKVWDVESGQLILSVRGDIDVRPVVFSPEGELFATLDGKDPPKVWNAQTGELSTTLTGHASRLLDLAFSPDGKFIATGSSDRTAKLWDARSGEEIATLRGHSEGVMSVAFSPDGKRVATGSLDGRAQLWDAQTGKEIATFRGHSADVISVTFSPEGERIVTASRDRTAKVWDAGTAEEIFSVRPGLSADDARFSADGKLLLTRATTGSVKLWDGQTGGERVTLASSKHFPEFGVYSVSFCPDGSRVVTFGSEDIDAIWDAQSGKKIASLRDGSERVTCAAFSPDGKRVATASRDHAPKLWDARAGRQIALLKGHSSTVTSIAFSPDGERIATGSRDRTAKVWDAQSGTEITTFRGHSSDVTRVAFSPDGKCIATGSSAVATVDGVPAEAKVWDSRTGGEILVLEGGLEEVQLILFSPDGERVAGVVVSPAVHRRQLKMWDAKTGLPIFKDAPEVIAPNDFIHPTFSPYGTVPCVAFSPDGKRLVAPCADRTVKVWNTRTGRLLLTLKGHPGGVMAAAFSPDGRRVVTGGLPPGSLKVWDAQTGREILTFEAEMELVTSVSFSRDGTKLLTGSADGTATIWDAFDWNLSSPEGLEKEQRERYRRWLDRNRVGTQPASGPTTVRANSPSAPDGNKRNTKPNTRER